MNFSSSLLEFEGIYNSEKKQKTWSELSSQFHAFWTDRIMSSDSETILDEDCDKIIKILDRSGKGNNKDSEALARAMVSQGAWRRHIHKRDMHYLRSFDNLRLLSLKCI